jgi:hypothetical protein
MKPAPATNEPHGPTIGPDAQRERPITAESAITPPRRRRQTAICAEQTAGVDVNPAIAERGSSNPRDSGRSCNDLGVAQEASRVHGWTLRPVHPVKRSRGRDSRMTSPSGLQSWEIFPPSWPETVARVRVAPNPSSSGGAGMAGPPRSVHVRT